MSLNLIYIVFGAIFGSFLNALIYRIPNGISIAKSRSFCPSCKNIIPWYCNIPILSYAFLLGRCIHCKTRINISYFLVEIFLASMTLYLGMKYSPLFSTPGLIKFVFFFGVLCAFTIHFVIDIKHKILPDSVNIYLGIIFLIYSFLYLNWVQSLIGAAIGFGFTYGVTWLFYKLRGKIGLGGGDIKLYTVLGIFLGPIMIVENIFLSCFLGAIVGIILIYSKIISRSTPIPFGPFIIVVAFTQIFFPEFYNSISFLFRFE